MGRQYSRLALAGWQHHCRAPNCFQPVSVCSGTFCWGLAMREQAEDNGLRISFLYPLSRQKNPKYLAGSVSWASDPTSQGCGFETHRGCRGDLKIKSWKKKISDRRTYTSVEVRSLPCGPSQTHCWYLLNFTCISPLLRLLADWRLDRYCHRRPQKWCRGQKGALEAKWFPDAVLQQPRRRRETGSTDKHAAFCILGSRLSGSA